MKKDGFVSLWIGNVKSEEDLDEILEVSYDEDGDYILPQFGTYFKTGRYDDDSREAEYFEQPLKNLNEIPEGFSYYESIIPKFQKLYGNANNKTFNTVIFLYNFEYDGTEKHYSDGIVDFEYIGTVQY